MSTIERTTQTNWAAVQAPERPKRRRGQETRQRLILVACDLFAEHGVDAVGMQEILARAGQRNASAIQYHFGSRAGLVVACLQPREDVRGPIEADRGERLAAISAGPQPPELRTAVDALVLPSLAYLRTHEGRSLIRVAAQVMRTLPIESRVDPTMATDREVTTLIASLLNAPLSEHVRLERLGVARTLVVELVANRARELEHGLTPHLDEPDFAQEMVAMTVGLLTAKPSHGAGTTGADPDVKRVREDRSLAVDR